MRAMKLFITGKTRRMKVLRTITLFALLTVLALSLALPAFAQTKYVITDGDSVIVCMSNSSDPQDVIREAGLQLGESDTYTTYRGVGISEIHINRVQMVSVEEGGQVYVVGSYGGTVADVLASLDITLSDLDVLSCTLDTRTYDGMTVTVTRVERETLEYDEVVPFETRYYESSEVPVGEEVILKEGADGLNHYTAEIVYEDGQEVQRRILSQTMVTLPQDAVVLKGVDRSVMEQTFENVDDYIVPVGKYTYTPPAATSADDSEEKLVPGTDLSYHKAVRFEATAYTCNTWSYLGERKTFTGTDARVGAIAVDPTVIPLGTRMYIASADGEYIYGYCVAEDTGALIKGNIVDLYYDTHDQCMDFGRRDVIIYFLD